MDYSNMLISKDITILDAMAKLDETAKKVLFVVDDEKKLIAAVSDGDIRRWILSAGHLDSMIIEAANKSPKSLNQENAGMAKEIMIKFHIDAIPIIDDEHCIIDIVFLNDQENNGVRPFDVPVVMMAGGLGTRLYPYTKILPKPLIPIGEIPISEHIINGFVKYGCKKYFLIVNHKKNMIKAYFNEIEKSYCVDYVDEEQPLGTGGGLSLLKGKVNETFIFTNCDILITEDFYEIYNFHKSNGNFITMICSLKNFQIPYGVVEIDEDGGIAEMKEKPSLSFFTNTGCYIVEPEVLDYIEEGVSIGFPTVIEKCKVDGKKIGVYPISDNSWLDMGQMDELEKMRVCLDNS